VGTEDLCPFFASVAAGSREVGKALINSTFFIDIDGVLYDGPKAIRGGPEAIHFLRANGSPMLLVTNTSRRSVDDVLGRLRGLGYQFDREEIYTAPMAALEYLRDRYGSARLFVIGDDNMDALFAAAGHSVTRSEEPVDAVIIGASHWSDFGEIDIARRLVVLGAEPIAMNRDPLMPDGGVSRIGAGPVVAALESVIDRPITLIGKPNPRLFQLALAHSGFDPATTIMVGDTPEVDVVGALAAGLRTLLVASGNHEYGADTAGADWVIDSIADLPTWYQQVLLPQSGAES